MYLWFSRKIGGGCLVGSEDCTWRLSYGSVSTVTDLRIDRTPSGSIPCGGRDTEAVIINCRRRHAHVLFRLLYSRVGVVLAAK